MFIFTKLFFGYLPNFAFCVHTFATISMGVGGFSFFEEKTQPV